MQLLTKPELREQLLTARNELKQARADNEKLKVKLFDARSECKRLKQR